MTKEAVRSGTAITSLPISLVGGALLGEEGFHTVYGVQIAGQQEETAQIRKLEAQDTAIAQQEKAITNAA